MATSEGEKQTCWYVMRDLKRANAKLPAYKQLLNEHFEVFTPMKEQLSVHGGKRTREEVPFIQDLLFVHDTQEAIDPFVEKYPTIQYRFQKGGGYKNPMTVADADMERFIHAVSVSKNPKYYLPGELTPSMCGRHIRIVGGPLDGYEGKLLTVRGSKTKRLLVYGWKSIPNISGYYKIMICKPDSILDDIWSKVKAVCIDYDLPDELRILKVMLRNKMSTGFCYLF